MRVELHSGLTNVYKLCNERCMELPITDLVSNLAQGCCTDFLLMAPRSWLWCALSPLDFPNWQALTGIAVAVAIASMVLALVLWRRLWCVATGETLCAAMLNTLPDLMIRMQRDGTYVDVRAGHHVLMRQPAQSLIGTNIRDFMPDQVADKHLQLVEAAIATGDIQTYDFPLEIDGQRSWQEGRIVALSCDEVLIAIRDITDYREAIEASRHQAEQSRAILTAIPDLMFQLSADGIYLGYVRPNQLVDLLPADFDPLGKHVSDYLSADHAQRNLYYLQRALATGEVQVYEQRVDLGDRIQHEEVRVVASGDNKGLFMVRDVSSHRHSEAERDRTAKQLQQQLNRALLLEQVTHEIRSHLDRQHIFVAAGIQIGRAFRVNRCLIHAYAREPEPMIYLVAEYGEPGYEPLQVIDIPVAGNAHAEAILADDRAIACHDVCTDPLLRGVCKMSGQLPLKSMLAIRTSYQNQPNGVIGLHQCDRQRVWTDDEIALLEAVAAQVGVALYHARLLEQEQLQREELEAKGRELERASQEAEAASRAKSAFLANMSHELRTPLNAILGFAQVMQLDESLSSETQEYISIILQSGDHLLKLINTVLDVSKIESGAMPLQVQDFNLISLIQQVQTMFQQQAEQKGVQLTAVYTEDVPARIITDEGKLRQILINLVGNAIKFTTQGSIRVRVAVTSCSLTAESTVPEWAIALFQGNAQFDADTVATPETRASLNFSAPLAAHRSFIDSSNTLEYLSIEVEDTGSGIPPSELDRIFEAFVQTEAGQMLSNGTGLGLTLSQKFVEMMGGTLRVKSQVGLGSTFQFQIPILLDAEAPRQASVQSISAPADTAQSSLDFPVAALQAMPPEWIEQLYNAAVRCDSVMAECLLDDIPSQETHLAAALNSLLHSFRFDHIAQILESVEPQFVVFD